MGLGFLVKAGYPKKRFWGRVSPEKMLVEIKKCFQDYLRADPFGPVCEYQEENNNLEIQPYPLEEPVLIEARENCVVFSARTSSAGPGYHAWLVDLAIDIGKKLGLEWQWQDEESACDETGYYDHRDFHRLQMEMAGWLQGLAEMILSKHDNPPHLRICLPLDFNIEGDYYAIYPMGHLTEKWLKKVSVAEEDILFDLAPEMFPWWDINRNERFWHSTAIGMCWSVLPWHKPINDRETALYKFALDSFDQAKWTAVPEYDEIRELLYDEESNKLPIIENRMGFKRQLFHHRLAGNWSILLPGYFYEKSEDKQLIYWFGPRSVHISAFKVEGSTRDKILEITANRKTEVGEEPYSLIKDNISCRGVFREDIDEDGFYHIFSGIIASDGSYLILTICIENDRDRFWMEKVIHSLHFAETLSDQN